MKNITLGNVHYLESMSEETHCFTATVKVDGKPFCEAKNEGHGGPTFFYPLNENDLGELERKIKQENPMVDTPYGTIPNSLELVVGDLLDEYLLNREVKKFATKLKKKIYLYDPKSDEILTIKKGIPNQTNLSAVKAKYPNMVVMNELDENGVREILFGQ